MAGFQLTSDTVALFKYNETSVPGTGYATAVDEAAFGGTARNLTETGQASSGLSANYTHIINGPDGQGYARWFPGSGKNAHLERAGDATMTAALLSSWTWEAWVKPKQQSQNVWAYIGGVSTSSAENCLGQVYFDTTGYINMFWETGSGTAVSSASSAGAITWDTWQHVAITVDHSGATATVKFYVNNTLVTTVTGKTKPTGGGNSDIYLGKDSHGNANYYGAIKDVRISNKVRDASEIATSVAAADYEHDNDANTLCLWPLNEEPDAFEETDYGYHARKVSGSIEIVDPLVTDSGRARHMDAATEYNCHWGYEDFRSMLTGDFTFQTWARFDSGYVSAQRGLWVYGDPGPESNPTNFVALDLNTTRCLQLSLEHGDGSSDTVALMTTPLYTAVVDGYNRHLITVTKESTGGTSHDIKFYLDDALIQTVSIAEGYDGGTSSWLRLSSGVTGGSNVMLGVVDDSRWLGRALSAAEVAASFNEGGGAEPNYGPSAGRRLARYGFR